MTYATATQLLSRAALTLSRGEMCANYGTHFLDPLKLPAMSADELWHEIRAAADGLESAYIGKQWLAVSDADEVAASVMSFWNAWEEMEETVRDLRDLLAVIDSTTLPEDKPEIVKALQGALARIETDARPMASTFDQEKALDDEYSLWVWSHDLPEVRDAQDLFTIATPLTDKQTWWLKDYLRRHEHFYTKEG